MLIYVVLTWFDKSVDGIQVRSWNPLDGSNMNNLHWIFAFGANGAIWGFVRLCILSYEGAMWLNLGMVLVMGLLWMEETAKNWIKTSEMDFNIPKALCLVSLSCILIGYECCTRDAEKKETTKQSTVDIII